MRPSGDQLGQAGAGDVLHHEIRNALGRITGGIEPDDVVVVDPGGGADLLDKSPPGAFIVVADEQNLERNDPSGGPVNGPVNRAHAAAADLGFDVIGAQTADRTGRARWVEDID